MAKNPNVESTEHHFESAMQRLEQIVGSMESEELPLEELIVRYEEGIKLVQVCETKLKAAEKKIELITRSAQGKVELSTFEPDANSGEIASPESREDVSLF